MENKKALEFFKVSAEKTKDALSCKLSSINDHTQMDADFILKYVTLDTNLLDLGSGSGLIINKIYEKLAKITAVEPYKEFTQFIKQSENIEIYNQTIMNFIPNGLFDLITIFGTMHYFNEEEAVEIYKKYCKYLKNGNKLIVKNQFGVNQDVIVDGYSEEQQQDYFASYRHIDKEVKLLEKTGYHNIEVVDIYPPECNRWENTHFYAIVAEK